jgi:hypothetical protein
MKNLINKCKYQFRLEGKWGQQTLAVDIYYKKKWIAKFNWCRGVNCVKEFDVSYNRIYKRR